MTGSPKRAAQVADMLKAGMPREYIARHLGLGRPRVAVLVHEARKMGFLEPFETSSRYGRAVNRLERAGCRMGSMRDVLDPLTQAEVDWLIDTLPNGLTLGEHIATMIRDACAEDGGNLK